MESRGLAGTGTPVEYVITSSFDLFSLTPPVRMLPWIRILLGDPLPGGEGFCVFITGLDSHVRGNDNFVPEN